MSQITLSFDQPQVPKESAIGGALEGAEMFEREAVNWIPSMQSPDQIINTSKPLADARARDMMVNDGYVSGAAALHKDNIVGSQYRLNCKPNWQLLGQSADWAEQFQTIVEPWWNALAESEECWLDASRRNTFTGMIRLAIGGYVITGEVLGTVEWMRDPSRPCKTAIQLVSPDRLCNPNGTADTKYLRRGVKIDDYGAPQSYHFRKNHPSEYYSDSVDTYVWTEVPARKPWGRRQVIHIMEPLLTAQSRGVSDMVAVLKQMRMTKKYQDVTLQNAVVNASYAAAIESELPSAEVFAQLGAGASNGPIGAMNDYIGGYLSSLGQYLNSAKNIAIDGTKIPHLFPGTKLNMMPVGTPGGVGTGFEESLLRHIAASLGLSYEQFSRDYTKTNYSSARASANETWKFMQSRKRMVADRTANNIYALTFEEAWNAGRFDELIPEGKDRSWFYEPLVKDALVQCAWIGASRGQVDELKETQAAILRIDSGLSTYEKELARLGEDFREVFEQRAREKRLMETLGLTFNTTIVRPSGGALDNAPTPASDEEQGAAQQDEDTKNE